MPEKIPHRSGELVRGGEPTASSVAQSEIVGNGYPGYVPAECVGALHREAEGVGHGIVRLELHIRHGQLSRYTVGRECSHIPGEQ